MDPKKKEYLALYIKGAMMGAADIVPGVSGGTIAFITGIYQRLIQSLSRLPGAIKVLVSDGVSATWQYINGTFLTILLCGMLSSILLLSNSVLYLLHYYPQLLWGFFFGLICASSFVLSKSIQHWNLPVFVSFCFGIGASYYLTTLSTTVIEPSLFNVFFAGMLAICAMILPGISGSFILLLLGMYSYILTAIKHLELAVLLIFAAGCLSGLLSFSKLLHYLFKHYTNITMSMLTGFLLGSLSKVWPWKETLTTRVNSRGETVPVLQQNISPFSFETITNAEPFLVMSCCLAIGGALLVIGLERLNRH